MAPNFSLDKDAPKKHSNRLQVAVLSQAGYSNIAGCKAALLTIYPSNPPPTIARKTIQ